MNITRITTELQTGNLVIVPTDTIYGILADALNPAAVKKVKIAKQRDSKKPLLILMSDFDMLRAYAAQLSPIERKLAETYFPGPLTILLPKNSHLPDTITGGSPLVGIRIPDNADLLEIIRAVGHPLISTSANLAGDSPITHPNQLSPELLHHISYVEKVGLLEGQPSTIVEVKDNQVIILRPGAIADRLRADFHLTK